MVILLVQPYRWSAPIIISWALSENKKSVLAAAEVYPDSVSASITGMILIEPLMMQPKLWEEDFKPHRLGGLALVSSRKESWKSKQEALLYFQNQHEWSTWDPRVVRLHAVCFFIFVDHIVLLIHSRNVVYTSSVMERLP